MAVRNRKVFNPKDISGHINLGQTFIHIDVDGTIKVAGGTLTADEMAGIATIAEILRRLRNGSLVTYDFDLLAFGDTANRMVSCEWLPSGRLKLNMEEDGQTPVTPIRRYEHAYNMAEAMSRHRSFTCSLSLYSMLPQKREPLYGKSITNIIKNTSSTISTEQSNVEASNG